MLMYPVYKKHERQISQELKGLQVTKWFSQAYHLEQRERFVDSQTIKPKSNDIW